MRIRACRGSETVEAALALPVLLLVAFCCLQLALTAYQCAAMSSAVSEAAAFSAGVSAPLFDRYDDMKSFAVSSVSIYAISPARTGRCVR